MSGSDDQTIMQWDVSEESWRDYACRVASRNLSPKEWEQFLGGEAYRDTCSIDDSQLQPMQLPPPAPPGPRYWRINVGGGQTTDSEANVWHGDQSYESTRGWGFVDPDGDSGTVNRWLGDPTLDVHGTLNDSIFTTERWAMDGYSIDLPNGAYEVRLSFAETFDSITQAGKRVFGVSIEGIPVFAGLDLYDQVGFLKALVTKSEVVVDDGQLNIEFTAVKDSPIINGIEILPAGS